MAASLTTRLLERLPDAQEQYHKLILAVGPAHSGKTAALSELATTHGWPRINVNLQLAEKLLDLTQKQRAVRMPSLLEDVMRATASEVVLLDNIEMLFAAELAQDPLRLLQGLSRNRTLIASWPGAFDGQTLTYAEPDHREFRKYSKPQVLVVNTGDAPMKMVAAPKEENA